MANLLIENFNQVEVLTEQTENGKQLYIEGIFAQAEVKNGNGRWYPKAIMEEAHDKYINEYVSKKRALGEATHPDYPFPNLLEAALLTESFEWQGNNIVGKAKILNTPKGQILKGLLEGGFNLGVSTRGLGTLKESNGIKYVQKGFMFTAVDAVDNPSGPNCYVNAVYESVNWQEKNGVWVPESKIDEDILLQMLENILTKRN